MTLKSRPHRTEHRERERSRPAEWILFKPIILKSGPEILEPSWRTHRFSKHWSQETALASDNFYRRMRSSFFSLACLEIRGLRTSPALWLANQFYWLYTKNQSWDQTWEFHPRANFLFFSEQKQQEIEDKERSGGAKILLTLCFLSFFLHMWILIVMPRTCTADNAQSWDACSFDRN